MDGHTSAYDVVVDQTPAPEPERTDGELIADTLEACGIEPTAEAVTALERLLKQLAYRQAGEWLRYVLRSVGTSPPLRALERVVLGPHQSLEADSTEVKCSRQLLHWHEKQVRKRLRTLTSQSPCRE